MSLTSYRAAPSRVTRTPISFSLPWVPAFAGMTPSASVMSLTSYRLLHPASCPQIKLCSLTRKRPRLSAAGYVTAEAVIVIEGSLDFLLPAFLIAKPKTLLRKAARSRGSCRPGSDLLSHALRHSTIGPGGLND